MKLKRRKKEVFEEVGDCIDKKLTHINIKWKSGRKDSKLE